jgi:hypothetical protein
MALTTIDRGDVFAGGTIAHVGRENLSVQARTILKAYETMRYIVSGISSLAIYENGDVLETIYATYTFQDGDTLTKYVELTNGILTAFRTKNNGEAWYTFESFKAEALNGDLYTASVMNRTNGDYAEERGYFGWLNELEARDGLQ